jgi:hypothetical protein
VLLSTFSPIMELSTFTPIMESPRSLMVMPSGCEVSARYILQSTFTTMTSEIDEKVIKAVELYRLVPAANTSFSYTDALVHVGVELDVARTETYRMKFNYHAESIRQRDGLVTIDNTDFGKVKRALDIMHLLPTLKQAAILKLAGWTAVDRYKTNPKGPSSLYMKYHRARANFDNDPSPPAQHPPPAQRPPPIQTINSDSREDLLSPLSASSGITPSSATENDCVGALTLEHYPLLVAQPSVASRTTASSNTRLTSHQAQYERRDEAEVSNTKKSAYKVGTFIYKLVQDGMIGLPKFKSADSTAREVNNLFEVPAISGRQILDACKNDRAGKSPPRRGFPSILPDADLQDLAMLCFSLSAIEQTNCAAQRLDNQGLISLVGKIVNEKRKGDGLVEIDEVHLYVDRIQKINASKQTVGIVDERDAIRVKWTTATNQRMHYRRWEEECVRLGFARWPTDDYEKAEKGHVVFYPGQENRIANFDEVHFALDGTDEHAGGRPSATPSTDVINESGKPAQKSSKACTLMFGIIGNEPMPPLVVFPSASSTINPLYMVSFHEILAQYGLPAPRHFLSTFASNLKGGVNNNIFRNWMLTAVAPLWPDLADSAGKRVMLKADSGPGRMATEFLAESAVDGMFFFPGLPNATEIGQEMDQLFAAFKSCAYKNRDKLYRARVNIDGADATLSFHDVGHLIFGGAVKLSNDTEIVLEAAFTKYFSREHIQKAREKCGYFPATRNALRSDRLRHELVEGEDEAVNEEEESYGSILEKLEQQNHSAVARLVEKGYALATLGKRTVERITASQTEGRAAVKTLPNTRERQDLLMTCSRAGHFFEATDGGGVMNSADMMLARERKDMLQRAKALEKAKKNLTDYAAVSTEAVEVFKKPYKDWLKPDFKIAIKYKHGPNAPAGETSITTWGKPKLKELYESKYKGKSREQRWSGWTDKQQDELKRLDRGDIAPGQDLVIYGRALQTQTDYLTARIQAVSKDSRMKVWKELASTLPPDEKVKIADLMSGRDLTAISDSSSEEDLDDDSSLATLVEILSDLGISDDEETSEQIGNSGARLPGRRGPGRRGRLNDIPYDSKSSDDDQSSSLADSTSSDDADARLPGRRGPGRRGSWLNGIPDDSKSSDDDQSSSDGTKSSNGSSGEKDDTKSSNGSSGEKEDAENNNSTCTEAEDPPDPPVQQLRRSRRTRGV